MTALTMSTPLSALDLSDLPDPFFRPPTSTAPSPTNQPLDVSTASTNSRSTSAHNPQNYTPVAPSALEVWIAASRTDQETQAAQPPIAPETAQLVRTPSSNPNDLFASFLQTTLRVQPQTHPSSAPIDIPDNTATPTVTDAQLDLERPLQLADPTPSSPVPHDVIAASTLSHSFTHPDRMIYTAPLRNTQPPNTAPLATPLITPMFSTSSDGLSAVERARKTADQFTMSQLARKRKAAGLDPNPKRAKNVSSSKSSTDDDEKQNDQDIPEKVSLRKYQKRLQKNRDSAFVSRIRRREYTKLLEESLATTEKEKDAAVNSFLEMKRRFDIVSAELNAFKQAAVSNLSAVRDSVLTRFSTTTTETQQPRSGSVVTSMFMFTLLFGILLPDCVRKRFGLQRYSAESEAFSHQVIHERSAASQSGMQSMKFGNTFSSGSHHSNGSRGKVWGYSPGNLSKNDRAGEQDNSCLEGTLRTIQSGTFDLLGAEYSARFLKLAYPYLKSLSTEKMAKLDDVFRRGNSTRFEQLIEIEALTREAGYQRSNESNLLLEHVAMQLENARL